MQEGLCHDIALRPFRGGRRVAIIDDADYLNEEGANCLLKTLEEPPPKSVMILIGSSPDRQLPTIRSRSQIIRFRPLATDDAVRLIRDLGLADDDATARRLAKMCDGSLERARRLSDPAFAEFRRSLYARLGEQGWGGAEVAKLLSGFADEAGKEAAARRDRLRWGIGFLIDLFRQTTHAAGGGPPTDDDDLQQAAERLARQIPPDVESLASVVDRCLDALEHVERNAHPTTLVDAFCDDVERLLSRATQATSP
jgi:DNA polymerase-3 subunit delta'